MTGRSDSKRGRHLADEMALGKSLHAADTLDRDDMGLVRMPLRSLTAEVDRDRFRCGLANLQLENVFNDVAHLQKMDRAKPGERGEMCATAMFCPEIREDIR